ncbi:hypothetical protein BaRGS_00006806 [Batillaria attramentaria]|uniref:G-protein coupled receptors family 3 profile domain-containing protein n=1 Tax=Batillaria attramentaria TaxID=370345 RepID=A0ABD0LQT5_9CAEN
MERIPMIVTLLAALLSTSCVNAEDIRTVEGLPMTFYAQDGDVVIGATFPIHQYSEHSPCGTELRELTSLQKTQAFVFAVEQINKNPAILPNLTLGFAIADDCSKDTTAMARALHFVQTVPSSGHVTSARAAGSGQNSTTGQQTTVTFFQPASTGSPSQAPLAGLGNMSHDGARITMEGFPGLDVVGVVGTESSPSTIHMASVLSLFHVPMLSYIATSPLLSNREKFPYFARIVPSDSNQGKVIATVLQRLNWTYVSIVYSAGSYGSQGLRAVTRAMEDTGACLASVIEVHQDFKKEQYDRIVTQLQQTPRAQAVVLFADLATCRNLFGAVARTNSQNSFTWVGSDALAGSLQDFKDFEQLVQGTITVNIHTKTSISFNRYFQSLTSRNCTNPWFRDFLEASYNCSFTSSGKNSNTCPEDLSFDQSSYKPEFTTSLIIDAVNVYAHALDSLLSGCNSSSESDLRDCFRGEELFPAILRTSFDGESGPIRFDSGGDGETTYTIQTLARLQDGTYDLLEVGRWDMRSQILQAWNPDDITWREELLVDVDGNPVKIPRSACSPECGVGEEAVEQPQARVTLTSPRCCWKCERCPSNTSFTWPDPDTRTRCDPIPPSNAGLLHSTGPAVPCADVVLLGVAVTVLSVYARNDRHHLIRASGRPLCYVAMAGVICSCFGVMFFAPNVTWVSCTASHVMFHLAFTVSYAPMVVRSYVIYRLHQSKSSQRRRESESEARSRADSRGRGEESHGGEGRRGKDGDGGRTDRGGRRGTGGDRMERHQGPTVKCQGIFTAVFILTQAGLASLSHVMNPDDVMTWMPSLSKRYVVTACVHKAIHGCPWASVSVTFNLLLLVTCAYLGFRTRRVQANFHESRWLSLGVFSASITWAIVLLTHLQVSAPHLDSLLLSVFMMLNAVIVLSCVFAPKLYAVYFMDPVTSPLGSRDSRETGSTTWRGLSRARRVAPATLDTIAPLKNATFEGSRTENDAVREAKAGRGDSSIIVPSTSGVVHRAGPTYALKP